MNTTRHRSPGAPGAFALVAGMVLIGIVAAAAPSVDASEAFDHAPFDELLSEYVAADGVDYEAWSASSTDLAALDSYIASVAAKDPATLSGDAALAAWINLYNALTLQLILTHYPLDGIRDLRKPWDRKLVTVAGQERTLNDIEHGIIRKTFSEPRIHFAVNCASKGCPPLRPGAYTADALDAQLEEQTIAFLRTAPDNFMDEKGDLHLSKILDWYAGDFEKAAGSVASFVGRYREDVSRALDSGKVRVRHESYDWSLNRVPLPLE
ncbi:MAG: DUF547 domain-containing protein [Gemmatimonadota bacterium]|jgi:hypothetical protein|nr:hypothetical protein [Gemmatimonadota bacterium]MDP6460937.1 DUF547 domain-containing protein [Gemmatimonadota bacterium]MDP6529047.1 DUF547 domain-containing protein [Gemmatimonadota bacterium]MDP6802655.1 DUF547 domain-containing protein [Gemmatimonadota bacterium]MDP7031654.1 DUF547 domain-containing protein [Gemmatimonadota bacterium]